MHKLSGIALGVGLIFLLDRVIKSFLYFKGGFFILRMTQNFRFLGIGLGRGSGILILSLIFLYIAWFIYKEKERMDPKEIIAVTSLVLGGASNLLDRVFFGAVIDYFSINMVTTNLADFLILGGVCSLIYLQFCSRGLKAK